MIKEITKYVAEEDESFVIGTDLFAGFVPSTITADHVVLIDTGGKPNFYLPDAPAKTVQALSKATDYHVAMANAMRVYNVLHGISGVDLPVITSGEEYTVNTAEAISEPQSLGQDDRGLFIISTNFILRVRDK
jgi:hypothetical protein